METCPSYGVNPNIEELVYEELDKEVHEETYAN